MRFFRPGAAASVALVALPVVALVQAAMWGAGDLWPHLVRHVLPQAAVETALLLAGVGAVVAGVGAGTAWLVSCYRFPGRRVLSWALILPLALPTYVSAYAWLDVMHPAGPVQSGLRALLGLTDPRDIPLPEMRSLGGCVLVMGSVLYPYAYLAARAAFDTQGADLLRAGRSLGAGGWRLLRSVGLPMAWPAIAAGTTLALLETLNDVGAAEFLGVRTLTVSVYVTWITRSSLEGAAQIALALLVLVGLLLALDGWARARARGGQAVREMVRPDLAPLPAGRGLLAALLCAVPAFLGFVVPGGYLLWAAWRRVAEFGLPPALGAWIANSVLLSAICTALVLPSALLLASNARGDGRPERRGVLDRALLRLSMFGYALPGGIAAVGMIVVLGAMDEMTEGLARWVPALSGTVGAVVLAYYVRFLAVPAAGLDAAYLRIQPQVDWSARSLGAGPWKTLTRIHLPQLLPALSASALLVFLDAMKELPATLLLRPFNRETLATALYAEAARGTYEEGAVAALALVVVSLPVIILLATGGRSRKTPSIRGAQRDPVGPAKEHSP
ncbi:ABC transporter permease [Roseomonas populi]|uniref:Iron ABC transporter permease n=1 Tax=Roseomonas populi TaxID=3121582 RepID=A0ABT1X5Y1_9PROT|nr:iron ABC transporter permease [Roseomonas pecuniae]MCR0982803.1 iron ABC transporter permease [Roseomonas pecuniae]